MLVKRFFNTYHGAKSRQTGWTNRETVFIDFPSPVDNCLQLSTHCANIRTIERSRFLKLGGLARGLLCVFILLFLFSNK